ncbi:MAG TPA: response regulator [Polyangiaceae bacterium]|nr:response regulator [Polyangiaceae bacterium]
MRLRGTTVLLVEDDIDNLEMLADCLKAEGALVLPAASHGRALAAAAAQGFDVLITDLELPDGDGLSLPRELRELRGLPTLPAIAISGYSAPEWQTRVQTSGFQRYAVKPFAIAALVDWVAQLSAAAQRDERA